MLCCTMHCQWEENPKNYHFPWDCVSAPEQDRATAIGNMHKSLVKCACGSGDMLADRQTQTHIHRDRHARSLQYFATAPAGKVTKHCWLKNVFFVFWLPSTKWIGMRTTLRCKKAYIGSILTWQIWLWTGMVQVGPIGAPNLKLGFE